MLRWPMIVGVVFLHSYDTAIGKGVVLHYDAPVRFILNYVSEGLATTAVPLFFLFSGFLFFWQSPEQPEQFAAKILKRGRSLLVPMIFWNLLVLAVTALAEKTPQTSVFLSGRSAPIASFALQDYLNAIFGITSHPIAYQFWFIRDLILLVLLSPMVYLLVTRTAIPFFAGMTMWWYSTNLWTAPVLSREAILFFSIGSLFAIRRVDLCRIDRVAPWCFLLYLPLSVLDAYYRQHSFDNPIHKAAELCGIVAVFCATRYVRQFVTLKNGLIALSTSSFFVFAAHEPLLTVIRKLSFTLFPPTHDSVILILYFVNTLLAVAICTAAYYLCRTVMPGFTGVVVGKREMGTTRSRQQEVPSLLGRARLPEL